MKSATKKAAPKKKGCSEEKEVAWARPEKGCKQVSTPRPRFPGPFSFFRTFPSASLHQLPCFHFPLQQHPERLSHPEQQRLELHAAAQFLRRRRAPSAAAN